MMSSTGQLYDNGKHRFTAEETARGVKNRLKATKIIKQITGMEVNAENLSTVLQVLEIFVATPMGQIILGVLATKGMARASIISETEAKELMGLIVGLEFVSALGPSLGGILADITKGGAAVAAAVP